MHRIAILALLLTFRFVAKSAALEITAAEGSATFSLENAQLSGLGGLVWLGGDRFAAVSDEKNVIQAFTLEIDAASGRISSGAWGATMSVPERAHSDFEGLAWREDERQFYVAAEFGHPLLAFKPGRKAVTKPPVPAIFRSARKNLGIESLTWNAVARCFWIANEEALSGDGALSSSSSGTLVRLQRLDAALRPQRQYAWRTEPASMRYGQAGSGVCDLCALDDGRLLVLERGFAVFGLQTRIYLADFSGATETTRVRSLAAATDILPAKKQLLYSRATGLVNLEGMTLGPALRDGRRSLILVADSGEGATHTFLALRLKAD